LDRSYVEVVTRRRGPPLGLLDAPVALSALLRRSCDAIALEPPPRPSAKSLAAAPAMTPLLGWPPLSHSPIWQQPSSNYSKHRSVPPPPPPRPRAAGKRRDQMPCRAQVQLARRIPHLGTGSQARSRQSSLPPAPGKTAARAHMIARTAAAGWHAGITPPGRSWKSPAQAPLPLTTWAGPPDCGSAPCARASAAPDSISR
jgi:hypothetical protein